MSTDIRQLLRLAIELDASDILLSVGSPAGLRVDGRLQPVDMPRLEASELEAAMDVLTDDAQRERWRRSHHVDFGISVAGRRLRGAAAWTRGQPTLALRLLPAEIPRPGALGVPNVLVDLLERPWGLLIATGPAGQGKTTTLASLIDVINRQRMQHVVTVEDPIEYVHEPVRSIVDQLEVGHDTPSFGEALRHVLRHNPDVIVVGEIRDRETLEAALTIAETGHLVMTTMHANDSVQAIDRMVSLFPADRRDYVLGQLGMVMAAIVNQRLVPGLEGGRVLASEVLMNSHAVANLVREGRTAQLHSSLETERHRGSKSLNTALTELVNAGKIHIAEARRHVNPLETDHLPRPS